MPTGHYPRKPLSQKTKERISVSKKGKTYSLEVRRAMSEAHKNPKAITQAKENIKKAQRVNVGSKHSTETRKKLSEAAINRYEDPNERIKASVARRGDKSFCWQGGKTKASKRLRNSIHFKLWREAVFSRDNWTCQECDERGGKLHPHHIKAFADYPDLRFAIDNGITLCATCHQSKHGLIKLTEVI